MDRQTKLALIQLVSEQTMQNVVPALALKPMRLAHLITPKVAVRSDQIAEAVRQAGHNLQLENVHLSQMPSLAETRDATLRAISEAEAAGLLPVVNFTGGTKLMSIGAHQAAASARAASIYVDTEWRHFTDGGTGKPLAELLGDDLSFTRFQRGLTVNSIAVANGCARVTGGKPFRPYQAIADHFLNHPDDENRSWDAVHGRAGVCPHSREPRSPHEWLELCRKNLTVPDVVAKLGSECGLLAQKGSGVTLACPTMRELDRMAKERPFRAAPHYFTAIEPLQFRLAFLSGGWWEVAIATAAEKCGRFRDLRWSAAAGERGFGGSMEEDIVAVDGVQIAYFSCKRGGARSKLTRQLEEMDASAKRLGGAFARKFFCTYLPVPVGIRKTLARRAAELHIRLIGCEDLNSPDCFGL